MAEWIVAYVGPTQAASSMYEGFIFHATEILQLTNSKVDFRIVLERPPDLRLLAVRSGGIWCKWDRHALISATRARLN